MADEDTDKLMAAAEARLARAAAIVAVLYYTGIRVSELGVAVTVASQATHTQVVETAIDDELPIVTGGLTFICVGSFAKTTATPSCDRCAAPARRWPAGPGPGRAA